MLYFDAAKFSIKLFSLVYFSVSIVRQRNEYEIMTETRPIKTKCSSHFQDVNLHKNPDLQSSCHLIKSNRLHVR